MGTGQAEVRQVMLDSIRSSGVLVSLPSFARLRLLWPLIVPDRFAQEAWPLRMDGGRLSLGATSGALAHEAHMAQRDILAALALHRAAYDLPLVDSLVVRVVAAKDASRGAGSQWVEEARERRTLGSGLEGAIASVEDEALRGVLRRLAKKS